MDLLSSDAEFRTELQSGSYVYVESHLCINSSQYLTTDFEGNIHLNPYARYHMDECCLVFDIQASFNGLKYRRSSQNVLNRDEHSDLSYDFRYWKYDNFSVAEKAVAFQNSEKVYETLREIEFLSGQASIKWCMDKTLDMSQEEFEFETGISDRTLTRMRCETDKC